jgi:methylated-DNA-[protein]-cysteine S-methyltransferase
VETTRYALLPSPIGELLVTADGGRLTRLFMEPVDGSAWRIGGGWQRDEAAFGPVAEQLSAYFAGELRSFDLPLAPAGTPFQLAVWEALRRIPYGETRSYGSIAAEIGKGPAASRAVGLANGSNPISIVVPCHRVIGADGSLTGYGGGLERKSWLLAHERAQVGQRALV